MKNLITYFILIFGVSLSFSQTDLNTLLNKKSLINLPIVDSIGFKSNFDKIGINRANWEKFGFDTIEKPKDSEFNYSIIGQIKFRDFKIVILEREFVDENIHWICLINNNKIIDFIQSAYDNSEGFLSVKSEIYKDKIKVKEWNYFDKKKFNEKIYSITENGLKPI